MLHSSKKINYLDGIRLHRAITAGIQTVISRQDYLNKINVFPVPDGDTGTNMAFTLTSILDGTVNNVHSRVDNMLARVADSALDGARGNSGAILAQFFQGLCDGSANIEKHDPESFTNAVEMASEYAREALAEPVEGTILTTLNDFSNQLKKSISDGTDDFANLIEDGLTAAEDSVKNSPNLLEVLKKSGVVDAGAQGFLDLLNGINEFIKNGSLKELDNSYAPLNIESSEVETGIEDLTYAFCTECLVTSDELNRKDLREDLLDIGNSLVLAGSKTRAKIHIHTNEPAQVFDICRKYGEVKDQKTDDMRIQQESAKGEQSQKIAIVTDSGADLPPSAENLNIHVVPVRYHFGNTGYIDKVSQTTEEFYSELKTNPIHPQTSQPTPGDFRRQYQFLSTHYKSVISIHLPQKLSGTLQSAQNAATRVPESSTSIIDSLNASVGQGLLVQYAAELAERDYSHDDIIKNIEKMIPKTKVYLAVFDLTYPVRGGRLKSSIKVVADFLRIRPVLTTDSEGKIDKAGKLLGLKNIDKKFAKFIKKKLDPTKQYRISIGHCHNESGGQKVVDLLADLPNVKSSCLIGMGCALGVHAGPMSLSAGIQEYPEFD